MLNSADGYRQWDYKGLASNKIVIIYTIFTVGLTIPCYNTSRKNDICGRLQGI